MITDIFTFIVFSLLSFINAVVDLFPMIDVTTNAKIVEYRDAFLVYLEGVNYLFPVATFISILTAVFLIESVVFNIKVGTWVIRILSKNKIPPVAE